MSCSNISLVITILVTQWYDKRVSDHSYIQLSIPVFDVLNQFVKAEGFDSVMDGIKNRPPLPGDEI
jgi:hypothetical protein